MIGLVNPPAGPGATKGYATAIAGLWRDLAGALTVLDGYAASPERLDEEGAAETLASLQYALHASGELALGLDPPARAAVAHAELADALAEARDVTADMAEIVRRGGHEAAAPLIWEWRGSLFRVRLARKRLAEQQAPAPETGGPIPHRPLAALVATVLTLVGALAVAGGATVSIWPVWVAGFVLVGLAAVAYRP
jgi:hypothetical protein